MPSDKSKDTLGDRAKGLEMAEAGRSASPGAPLLCRLDGRAFSQYTRPLARPYDARFLKCMRETTAALVDEFHPSLGYTQSDEISLAWYVPVASESQYPFGGRYQKICSVLAGYASVIFAKAADKYLPELSNKTPCFDARSWSVPTMGDALDVFIWREIDATKNSVQMAARAVASHRQLDGKNKEEQLAIIEEAGIDWNKYPTHFKRGIYLQRAVKSRQLTAEELSRIPEAFRPDPSTTFDRSEIEVLDIPPIRAIKDAATTVLFRPKALDF